MAPLATGYRQNPLFADVFNELGVFEYGASFELPTFCEKETIAGLCE